MFIRTGLEGSSAAAAIAVHGMWNSTQVIHRNPIDQEITTRGAWYMLMGKVVGTVVSTQKDEGMVGFKLLVVQNLDLDMNLASSYTIAVDAVGAGMDEVVIVVQGSSARLTDPTSNKPVDAAIICIVDSVDIGGRMAYEKRNDPQHAPRIEMVKTSDLG